MRKRVSEARIRFLMAAVAWIAGIVPLIAADPPEKAKAERAPKPVIDLTSEQWQQLDKGVDNGLKFLATQQEADGSFRTLAHAKPGVTGLCVLAFLSRGHLPKEGPYGESIQRAVDFVLSTQRADGLLTIQQPEPELTSHGVSHAGMYNHAFAGLMLSEVYGATSSEGNDTLRKAIQKGLAFSQSQQVRQNRPREAPGGYDYLIPSRFTPGGDLPITSGQLLFYRSAKNAGFEVPVEVIDAAMRYVRSCWDPPSKTFRYRGEVTYSRGLTGSGILALSLGGEHQTKMAQEAGDWVLTQSFEPFNVPQNQHDRYFYSAFYCSQGMFQLGGERWGRFYPALLTTLSKNQQRDGSWNREMSADTSRYGNAYSSALAILAMTPPYQLLPIYQR